MNYKIAIIDDEEDARELIKIHLRRYPNLILIGEASNGKEATELIKNAKPEIVLLDITNAGNEWPRGIIKPF